MKRSYLVFVAAFENLLLSVITSAPADGEPSAQVRERVIIARQRQNARLAAHGLETNAEIAGELLDRLLPLSQDQQQLLEKMAERFALTARGYHRLLRVARTIADLAGADQIKREHLLEASAYRRLSLAG